MINELLGVLLRFWQEEVGIVGDRKKMYNAIALSEFDQHVHKFLWRDMTFDKPPDHYIMTSLGFDDKTSGAIAAIALQRTADMYENVFPRASEVVRRNSYVDDLIKSVNNREEASNVIEET